MVESGQNWPKFENNLKSSQNFKMAHKVTQHHVEKAEYLRSDCQMA